MSLWNFTILAVWNLKIKSDLFSDQDTVLGVMLNFLHKILVGIQKKSQKTYFKTVINCLFLFSVCSKLHIHLIALIDYKNCHTFHPCYMHLLLQYNF